MFLSRATDVFSVVTSLLVSLAALITGLFILGVWYREWRNARASRSWPTISGRMITSRLDSFEHLSTKQFYETYYTPVVAYEYKVDGKTYQGTHIAMGVRVSSQSRKTAERMIAPYPVGAVVEVFYNPANPEQAVLERRVVGGGALIFVALVVLIGVGATQVLWHW